MVPPTLSMKQGPRAIGQMGPRLLMKGVSLERRQYVISLGKREKGEQRGGTVERCERVGGRSAHSHWRQGHLRSYRVRNGEAGKVCISPQGMPPHDIMSYSGVNKKLLSVPEFRAVADATTSVCLSCMNPHPVQAAVIPFPEPELSVQCSQPWGF